jgi:hypothetical protein
MTETIPEPESIVKAIREGSAPTGEMADLSRQAQRLRRALDVANEWEKVAARGSTDMFAQAEYTRDKFEEELCRVCFEMDLVEHKRLIARGKKERGEELSEDELDSFARGELISDTLLDAYMTLSYAPLEIFGQGDRVAEERTRYSIMGALLEAMDAVSPDKD